MQGRLTYKTDSMDEEQFLIGQEVSIGKDSRNNVVIRQNDISRKHARIYLDDEKKCYYLEDLDSQNGTFLDGEKISTKEPLLNIHIITLGGQFDLFFQVLKTEQKLDTDYVEAAEKKITIIDNDFQNIPESVSSSAGFRSLTGFDEMAQELLVGDEFVDEIAGMHRDDQSNGLAIPEINSGLRGHGPKMPIESTHSFRDYQVENKPESNIPEMDIGSAFVLNLKGRNEKFTLKEGGNIIGRIPMCNIVIGDGTVSRQHACILIQDNRVSLNDLGSKNSTFIGRKKIRKMTEISPNSRIRFGEVEAVLAYDGR